MADDDGYRAPDVAKIVGISYRQLDYWARTGLVTPSVRDAGGSGTQREYSFQDIVLLRAIKNLLDTGVNLQRIRKAIEFLREHLRKPPAGLTLLSDGNKIYACESPSEVMDLLQRGQGVFGIAVDRVWSDVEGSVRKTAKETARAGGA
ncbi:MAG: MerR family transcriptional regulator [Actinomycetota bacterium]